MLNRYERKLDFEVGHLIQSPCRSCPDRIDFPVCMQHCRILDGIQEILSKAVSCTRLQTSLEASARSHQGWGR